MHSRTKQILEVLNEKDVVDKHCVEDYTIRQLCDFFKLNRNIIRNILRRNNVVVNRRNRLKQLSDEHKTKISLGNKGKHNIKRQLCSIKKSMICRMTHDISVDDLDFVDDIRKFSFLTQRISRHSRTFFNTKEKYLEYFKRFYNDEVFNCLYQKWIATKNKEQMPTLDHIIPMSRGGTWDIGNLRYITWFENKCKGDMLLEEWEVFKQKTNTKSDLFI